MVGTGRVARCRTYALIFFCNKRIVIEILILLIAPVFLTYEFVHVLSEGFCKTISNCFEHNGTIVIMILFKFGDLLFNTETGRQGKGADIIFDTSFLRSNKVGESKIGLPWWFASLLSQSIQITKNSLT